MSDIMSPAMSFSTYVLECGSDTGKLEYMFPVSEPHSRAGLIHLWFFFCFLTFFLCSAVEMCHHFLYSLNRPGCVLEILGGKRKILGGT